MCASAADIDDCLKRALDRRQHAPEANNFDAWRVLNGPGDGGPAGLAIDRYLDKAVLWARDSVPPSIRDAWTEATDRVLSPTAIVLKLLKKPATKSSSVVVKGQLPSEPVAIREGDAVFLCDLDDGISTGLFLDHRETRLLVRQLASGREVLNLFAYTCSFSVQAVLGGASRVTSVDISRKALRRGRENMTASGCRPEVHRWFDDDVLRHLSRARRTDLRYGLIVLDPPVFGRAGTATFSLDQHLPVLIENALALLAPQGILIFSTHSPRWRETRLWDLIRQTAQAAHRRVELVERRGLPSWDHPVSASDEAESEEDRGNYLTTLVLRSA